MHPNSDFSLASLFSRPFFWVFSSLLLLVSFVLALIPLTNVLGLEYSLFFGAPATLLCAHLGLRGVWERAKYSPDAPGLWGTALRIWSVCILALLPSLLVICGNAFFVRNCNWSEGLAYFALLPGIGSFWGMAFGMGCALIPKKRVAVATLYLIPLATVAWVLWGAFAHPPIFAYNLFFGYYPGSLYDELRTISTTLLLYRLWTVLFGVAILGLLAMWAGRRGILGKEHFAWREAAWSPSTTALDGRLHHTGTWESSVSAIFWSFLAVGTVCAGYLYRHDLGFVHTNASIQRALGGRMETPNFILYYDVERTRPAQIQRMARDHEFRYHQLVRYFGHRPKRKIEAYLFVSAAQKNKFIGAERTMIARPWAYQIYLHGIGFPHSVLKHELAHVFSAAFGHGFLRISAHYGVLPLNALIEGVAVAADWDRGSLTPHQWCKAMLEHGYKLDPARILGPAGFFRQSSSVAYRVAGSFSRYLIDRYGMQRYKQAYGKAEFSRVYQRSLAQLSEEWREYLRKKVKLSQADRNYARYAFRTFRSIFKKVCPHEIAALRTHIASASQTKRLQTAIRLQERLCTIDNHPYNQISTVDLLLEAHEDARAHKKLEEMRKKFTNKLYPVFHSRILQRLAQLHVRKNNLEEAKKLLQSIPLEQLPFSHQRPLWIRMYALQHPHLTHVIFDYIDQSDSISSLLALQRATLKHPDDIVLAYLLGRRLYYAKQYEQAETLLSRAAQHFKQTALLVETHRLLATSAFLRGAYTLSQKRFLFLAKMKLNMPSGLRADAHDWAERARWEEKMYREPPPAILQELSRNKHAVRP